MFEPVLAGEVRGQRESLADVVRRLDPDSVPAYEAPGLRAEFDRIAKLAATARTLLARRVEDARAHERTGKASAAEQLAGESGTSVGAARSELEASKALGALPVTQAAARQGDLSPEQTAAIAAAAAADPGAEAQLVELAGRASLAELRAECARVKAAADPDPGATYRRIHKRRCLRRYVDGEGAWNLHARGTVDAGSVVESKLEPIIDELFHQARREGRREPREAYAFDALVELARRHTEPAADADAAADAAAPAAPSTRRRSRQPSHLALLRLDLEALVRGAVDDDEYCEITGLGPIPVSVARLLLGDSILKLVITRGVDVANVTHLGRGPSAAQKVALLWSSPHCSVEGCDRTRREIDHRRPWADSHQTRLDQLDPYCGYHHDRKTYDGWALVAGTGRRPMVPPDDPRHPANSPPAHAPPATRQPEPDTQTLFDPDAA